MNDIDFDRRTIAGTRCADCAQVHVPARLHRCQRCGSLALTSERVGLQGVFESWTSFANADPGHDEFALGLVTLDAGPMLTVRIRLTQSQEPCVGAPVTGWTVRRPGAVDQFWFELAEGELAQRGAA